jgi:hypothetical protein
MEEELGNCATPSVVPDRYLIFTAMLFGFEGAPLIMGRSASTLARLLQSLIPPDEMQSQLYMDDPLWMLQGPRWRRQENLAPHLVHVQGFSGQASVQEGLQRH